MSAVFSKLMLIACDIVTKLTRAMNLKICTHLKDTMAKETDQNQGNLWLRRVIINKCIHI